SGARVVHERVELDLAAGTDRHLRVVAERDAHAAVLAGAQAVGLIHGHPVLSGDRAGAADDHRVARDHLDSPCRSRLLGKGGRGRSDARAGDDPKPKNATHKTSRAGELVLSLFGRSGLKPCTSSHPGACPRIPARRQSVLYICTWLPVTRTWLPVFRPASMWGPALAGPPGSRCELCARLLRRSKSGVPPSRSSWRSFSRAFGKCFCKSSERSAVRIMPAPTSDGKQRARSRRHAHQVREERRGPRERGERGARQPGATREPEHP